MTAGTFLLFPLSTQAFGGVGNADVLEYTTDTEFELLEPANSVLQWGFYHPDDVWLVSDNITIGGDAVGVVSATGAASSGFVSVIDLDIGLTTPPKAGDVATNGTTAQTLTDVAPGVKVGGTGTWGFVNGLPAWNPQGDHSLRIPNALATPYFGISDREPDSLDMGIIWRQQYRTVGTSQYLMDFGSRKSGTDSGGYSYQPNITNDHPRVQFAYSALDSGVAGYVIGAQAEYITASNDDEVVCCTYQSKSNVTRTDMALIGNGKDGNYPTGAYFDSGNSYEASDLPEPIPGGQHGYDLRLLGRSDGSGNGFVDGLGGGGNDYSIRDLVFFFPTGYLHGAAKSYAVDLAKYPNKTVGDEVDLPTEARNRIFGGQA